ncbi:MAG: 3-oxoacyl-ACP reductase FabG [Deltaproteobacteria bacterium]|nr:3-oxoacyl-ACP reductase FabG [Deltaproteobacteria bacterium]
MENIPNYFNLKGKTALVTGAAGGLGKEISIALAQCHASVILADIEYPRKTHAKISDMGVRCMAIETDITNESQVKDLVDRAASEFGSIDILINNAGVSQLSYTPTEDLPVAEWDRVIGINLKGTFLCCKHIGKLMILNKGGAIVNIASTAGFTGVPRAPAYCASKAGIILLTKSLALEWAEHHIRVNAVAPHYLETSLTQGLRKSEKVYNGLKRSIPLKRFGKPSDITATVLLLVSEASNYTTGTVIPIDGGYLAQ